MLAEGQKERLLDHNEWMNDEVREEIEDLQRTHGFEEDEACGLLASATSQKADKCTVAGGP